jgi:HKD family nuclease
MLHPKHNRIDYGEQLIPPEGYKLVRAIGTTYSLDLEALMILPVALFYSQNLDGDPNELRYDMLDAITKASERITVYYQNSQLKVPKKYNYLMANWEKGIKKVTMPNHLSSFHPKVWIIRYEKSEETPVYRLLVTSRNLTFARDWDIAFSTDGIVTNKNNPSNIPLAHFLEFLNTTNKQEIDKNFIKDLLRVDFELPEKFESLKFHSIGVPIIETLIKYPNPIIEFSGLCDELFIISPFLQNDTLSRLSKTKSRKSYLLSRKEELDSIDGKLLLNFDKWQFSKFFEEAEKLEELSEENIEPHNQSLHAKFYIIEKDNIPYWFLGSANCSDPAQDRNIEFMVELKGNNTYSLRARDVLKSLTNTKKSEGIPLFTPYDINARESTVELKNIEKDLRFIKYQLSILEIKGIAKQVIEGSAYDLTIEIDASSFSIPEDYHVRLKPLPEQNKSAVEIDQNSVNTITKFTGYSETALSPFLEIEIWFTKERLSHFLLQMEIDLPSSRLDKIFTSIIDSRDKFLKYLAFILSGDTEDSSGIILDQKNKGYSGNGNNSGMFSSSPLFENLLVAASRHPEKLKSIDSLINRIKTESSNLKEPIITSEFESFWQIFKSFIKSKK